MSRGINERIITFRDDQVNFPIQKGLQASRSVIRFFKHNDPRHLEQMFEEQRQNDLKVWQKIPYLIYVNNIYNIMMILKF